MATPMRKPTAKARSHPTARQFKKGRKKIEEKRAVEYRKRLIAEAEVMNPIVKQNSIELAKAIMDIHKSTGKPIDIADIAERSKKHNASQDIVLGLIIAELNKSSKLSDKKLLRRLTRGIGKMLGII